MNYIKRGYLQESSINIPRNKNPNIRSLQTEISSSSSIEQIENGDLQTKFTDTSEQTTFISNKSKLSKTPITRFNSNIKSSHSKARKISSESTKNTVKQIIEEVQSGIPKRKIVLYSNSWKSTKTISNCQPKDSNFSKDRISSFKPKSLSFVNSVSKLEKNDVSKSKIASDEILLKIPKRSISEDDISFSVKNNLSFDREVSKYTFGNQCKPLKTSLGFKKENDKETRDDSAIGINRTMSLNVIPKSKFGAQTKSHSKLDSALKSIITSTRPPLFPTKKAFFKNKRKSTNEICISASRFKYYISSVMEVFQKARGHKSLKDKWNIKKLGTQVSNGSSVKSIIFEEHFYHTLSCIKYFHGKYEMGDEKNLMKISFPQTSKPTLVLDLDETLIHAIPGKIEGADKQLQYKNENGILVDMSVFVRPGLYEFLDEMGRLYDIIVFTASTQGYADMVMNSLGSKWLDQRIYRPHCTVTSDPVFIKDLRVISGRSLDSVLLVDNASHSFIFQIPNGIPIIPFYDDPSDKELPHLQEYLTYLAESVSTKNDIVEANEREFRLSELRHYDSPDAAIKEVWYSL